jgi:type VI secretion system protein
VASRGLLSRIGVERSVRSASSVESIIEHLNALLNSRQGECETATSFGIPDFTDLVHGFPASIETLERAIKTAVTEYETRLEAVSVRHVPDSDPLVVKFEIAGRIARDKTTLRLRTRMSSGGHVRVTR